MILSIFYIFILYALSEIPQCDKVEMSRGGIVFTFAQKLISITITIITIIIIIIIIVTMMMVMMMMMTMMMMMMMKKRIEREELEG